MSILRKRVLRPIEKGSFCTIKAETKQIMKTKFSHYKDDKNRKLLLVESEILLVLDENVLGVKGLVRVVPVLMDHSNRGYGVFHTLMNTIYKGKSYLIDSKNLLTFSSSWKKELDSRCSSGHQNHLIRTLKENYLDKRLIDLEWENK